MSRGVPRMWPRISSVAGCVADARVDLQHDAAQMLRQPPELGKSERMRSNPKRKLVAHGDRCCQP